MVQHGQEQGSVFPALFPSPGLLLLSLGEVGALLGVLLRSDYFRKRLLHIACREERSTAGHAFTPASQGPVFSRKLFLQVIRIPGRRELGGGRAER